MDKIGISHPQNGRFTHVIAIVYKGKFDSAVAFLDTPYDNVAEDATKAIHQLNGKVALYKVACSAGGQLWLKQVFVPQDGC